MLNEEKPKAEVVRFLEWIDQNPIEWEQIFGDRCNNTSAPIKITDNCDMLTFSGLHCIMLSILFSETSIVANRVFKRIVARSLLQRIEEIGEFETSKEVLRILNEECNRADREAKLPDK